MGSREAHSRVAADKQQPPSPPSPVGVARALDSSAASLPAASGGSRSSSGTRFTDHVRTVASTPAAAAAIPRSLRPIRVPSSSAPALPPLPPAPVARAARAAGGSAETSASRSAGCGDGGGAADLDSGYGIDSRNGGAQIRAGDAGDLSFGRWQWDAGDATTRSGGCSSSDASKSSPTQCGGDDEPRAATHGAALPSLTITVATATALASQGSGSDGKRQGEGGEPCDWCGGGGGGGRGVGGEESDAADERREDGRCGEAREHAGTGRDQGTDGRAAARSRLAGGRACGGGAWPCGDGAVSEAVWPIEQDADWRMHGESVGGRDEEKGGKRASERASGTVAWVEKEMCTGGEGVVGGGGEGGVGESRGLLEGEGDVDASVEEREYSVLCHSPRYAAYRERRPSAPHLLARASSSHEAQVRRFRSTLRCLALDTSSRRWAVLTWASGVALLGVVPCCLYAYVQPADDRPQHKLPFQLLVLVLHNALGALAFLFLRASLRTHGLHAVLFLDSAAQEDVAVQLQYDKCLHQNRAMLMYLLLPLFLLHLLHKALLFACIPLRIDHPLLPARYRLLQLAALFLLSSLSWLFAASTFLFTCVLFWKACSLQELKMQGYRGVVQRCSDPAFCFFEYTRISAGLAAISRRFRLFLLLAFSITLLGALASMFHMVQYRDGPVTLSFINSGHLVVANVVALVGTGICLRSASKLAHLHRRIVRVASAMHAQHTFDSAPLLPPTPPLPLQPTIVPPFPHTVPPSFSQSLAPPLSAFSPTPFTPAHQSQPSSMLCPQPSSSTTFLSYLTTTNSHPTAPSFDLVAGADTDTGSGAFRPYSSSVSHRATNTSSSANGKTSSSRSTNGSSSCSGDAPACSSSPPQHHSHPSLSLGLSEPLLSARARQSAAGAWAAQDPAVLARQGAAEAAAAAGEGQAHGMGREGSGERGGDMELAVELLKRQEAWAQRAALVNFLSSSAVGISVYGFVLDRVFIHTSVGALLTTTWFILGQSLSASFKPR
ncbi:hypothetical protein CLOM_g16981 [Closterium sp. NIES-68]|nr:hypothetical protein CLOM_g16981 [Closterium sp. NIES-68]